MKTILYFQSSFCESNQRQLAGVYDIAREVNWNVQVIEYGSSASSLKRHDLKTLFSFWNPDGCIVDCGGATELFEESDFRRIPVVFIDRHPTSMMKAAACVTSDSAAIARVVAKELLPRGFAAYAYVDWYEPHVWSKERGDEFAQLVELNGKRLYRHRMLRLDGKAHQVDLMRWLKSLPKPCGIFAVNDRTAGCVISAALRAKLDVPGDISVVGVDNDIMQCENSPVAISSVPMDREGGGRIAGKLLKSLMDGGKSPKLGLFSALPLVRRASTLRFSDSRVYAAVEFIRIHACKGLKVGDVVAVMGCSRSLAYLRFGNSVGHSILEEIHHVRIERAKELLKARKVSTDMIADSCGYASVADFRRTFRRVTGLGLREWLMDCAV